MSATAAPGPVLALDTGSPRVSVAVAADGKVLASRSLEQSSSSRELLPAIDEVLGQSGLTLRDLGGLLALSGPGSFTGLRVGLATVLGLHQATGLPATTLPTLDVLAQAAAEGTARVLTAIDARRGEWVLQAYDGEPRRPLGASRRCPADEIPGLCRELWPGAALESVILLGYGAASLGRAGGPTPVEPAPLADTAALQPFRREILWDAGALTRPLYFRPPAVTVAPSP